MLVLMELCMSCKDKMFVEGEDKIDHWAPKNLISLYFLQI